MIRPPTMCTGTYIETNPVKPTVEANTASLDHVNDHRSARDQLKNKTNSMYEDKRRLYPFLDKDDIRLRTINKDIIKS